MQYTFFIDIADSFAPADYFSKSIADTREILRNNLPARMHKPLKLAPDKFDKSALRKSLRTGTVPPHVLMNRWKDPKSQTRKQD